MPEYGFSLICIFPHKERIYNLVLTRKNVDQRKPLFWHVLCSDPVVVNLVAQKFLKNGGIAFFDPRI